ncbi:hypothetical protein NPX13_g7288 [Xylaria arbuscula]|uniref:Uncharacterized protein n=1 Tax=Xylaria arbuscula TaxID=114810 RepID=A0A9W8NB81_9PEZI|nr:hypothetical protein NPX13_g7288 [Xylaria arbuscula]
MASNFDPTSKAIASTPASSPSDFLLGSTKIQRSLVKIPGDQKKLLSGYESWASNLGRRPNGFINVPPQVLDQVKAAYIRQKKATQLDASAELLSQAEYDSDAPEPSGNQSSSQPHAQEGDKDDDDEGDADENVSWAASPEHHLRPPSANEEPDQPFLTQLPDKLPPKPTLVTSSPAHRPALPEFPLSSQGPEEELEVEVPAALNYNVMSINKSSLPMLATPPSAQVVPCTLEQSLESSSTSASKSLNPQMEPKMKKHKYKSVPELYRGPKLDTASSHLNIHTSPKKATATPNRRVDGESSLSTNDTSPLMIPSTKNDAIPESDKHITDGGLASSYRLADPRSDNFRSHSNPEPELSAQTQPTPLHVPSSPERVTLGIPVARTPVAPPIVVSKTWDAPFVYYTSTYPSYRGTINDFIMACVYIQLEQRASRIRTSLYDDFIRAWVDEYRPYVRDCDKAQPARKALSAIEWYNRLDNNPLFTQLVVTRDNLQHVLDFYPRELKVVKKSLGIISSQESNQSIASESEAEIEPENQDYYDLPDSSPPKRQKGKEPIYRPVEQAKPKAPVPNLSSMPPLARDKRVPLHKSFGGIEARPAQHEGLTRSLSESTMHRKRTAVDELRSEGTKRASLGPAPGAQGKMWSDTGSTTSNHSDRSRKNTPRTSIAPSSTAKKEKGKEKEKANANETPEERRARRLSKHMKKLAGRMSIGSSAPLSNSPTSGQKH